MILEKGKEKRDFPAIDVEAAKKNGWKEQGAKSVNDKGKEKK